MAVIPELPQTAWEEAERRSRFWEAHYEEYLQAYPEQYVAVKSGEVVAFAADQDKLRVMLREKGLEWMNVWVEYIAKPRPRIL